MKKKSLVFLMVSVLIGCSDLPWSKNERNTFLDGCDNEGGDAAYCDCFMKEVMDAFPDYESWHNISLEESVELAGKCD